ncbi:MAG: DOPA 4,5-dioxygenase family protein [Sphingomicrobium sp.]
MTGDAPFHAHIYYSAEQRFAAEALREAFTGAPEILFVGSLADRPVGPHPVPQFETHFFERSLAEVVARIEASGLRALVHPLTDDDLADHSRLAQWIGEPLALDKSVLDRPGVNQGVARFGKSDF